MGAKFFSLGTRVFFYLNDLKIIFGLVGYVHSTVNATREPIKQVLYPAVEPTSATRNAKASYSRCTTMTALILMHLLGLVAGLLYCGSLAYRVHADMF